MTSMDIIAVETIIKEVTDAEIRPRFRALADGDISLKGPGDYVTAADVGAERELTARLRSLADVPVVGEEAAAANDSLLSLLQTEPTNWVVDPIDGTANFVAGREGFAVMVALVEYGVPTAGWIYQPGPDIMVSASQGQGARLNGQRLSKSETSAPGENSTPHDRLQGWFSIPHAPPHLQPALGELAHEFSMAPPGQCAGMDYVNLATGSLDFVIHFNTKPWDHAPGTSIVRELGVRVATLDGSDYTTAAVGTMILAAHEDVWETVCAAARAHLDGA